MRILFLSNFYPPARPGGYTQWCYEVATCLQARGHTIGVLTSHHELDKVKGDEENVYRLLHLDGDLFYYRPFHFFRSWSEQQHVNKETVRRVIAAFAPDVVFVWGMWAISKVVPAVAEAALPGRVVYYLSDYWPMERDMHSAYWEAPPRHWYMHLPKRALRIAASRILARERQAHLRFEHAICVSYAVKRQLVTAGLPLTNARVIHGGTDVARFTEVVTRRRPDGCLKLLYAGQVVEHKGVHTAIEAMVKLTNDHNRENVHLTIMGSGHPAYESHLRGMVTAEGVDKFIHFRAPVARADMPAVLAEYDVLIFPSIYEEPLARMTQEAMASGMVVIGTTTGGTGEILKDGRNGLTFPAGDSTSLARQIQRLLREPDLAYQLAAAGQQSVLDHFTLGRMVDEIEAYLRVVMEHAAHRHIATPG